jgi:hypothetical protein
VHRKVVFVTNLSLSIKTGTLVSVDAMEAYRGRRCITPLILNFGTKWRQVVNITPQSLHPQERTPVPTVAKTGWDPDAV